jgi:hypothetical protein
LPKKLLTNFFATFAKNLSDLCDKRSQMGFTQRSPFVIALLSASVAIPNTLEIIVA